MKGRWEMGLFVIAEWLLMFGLMSFGVLVTQRLEAGSFQESHQAKGVTAISGGTAYRSLDREIPVGVYHAWRNYQQAKPWMVMLAVQIAWTTLAFTLHGLFEAIRGQAGIGYALLSFTGGFLFGSLFAGPFLAFASLVWLFSRRRLLRWEHGINATEAVFSEG
jgi:hypothetical protein